MNNTKIAWATHTSNVVTGCHKPAALPPEGFKILMQTTPESLWPNLQKWRLDGTSPECIRCYAETISHRYRFTTKPWQVEHAVENVTLHPKRMDAWMRLAGGDTTLPPSQRDRVFACSMGDLFHERVPDEYITEVFSQIRQYPAAIFMLLTKRIARAAQINAPWARRKNGGWPEHAWLGTTVGHPITKWRMEYLRRSEAAVRFVSMEPLVASLTDGNADALFGPLNLHGIHQVIIGGESGGGYRRMEMQWARDIRDRARREGCAFFFKQDAAALPGRRPWLVETDGRRMEYHQFPGELTPPRELTDAETAPEPLAVLP